MSINHLNILVTGGAGFIGSNIVEYLINNQVKFVRIIDNLSTGNINNISKFLECKNIEFIKGDISDPNICKNIVKGIDVICHQAALGSVPRSINNPYDSHNSNVNGFFNILNAAREQGIKRFVYASSSSVYGDIDTFSKKEELTGNLLSPYGVTKYIDELYAKIFYKIYDMECIGLRYFNVFGPKQNPLGSYAAVIPNFISKLINNQRPIINGDGLQSRDFTFVSNVVFANILSLTTINKDCYGQVFNIGCGQKISVLDLFNLLNMELGTKIEPEFQNKREGDITHSLANIEKSKIMLNYFPIIDLKKGIGLTINYYKTNL